MHSRASCQPLLGAVLWIGTLLTCDRVAAQEAPTPEQLQFFEKHIRPVLVEQCYSCHGADSEQIEGELTLDTRAGIRKGGSRGPAVVPGDVRRSVLIEALRRKDEDLAMPPKQALPAEVVANFEKWVAMGAPDPRDGEAAAKQKYGVAVEEGRQHWSFQPPRESTPPEVRDASWPRSDIDRYVLAPLEAKGLAPVGDADARTLARRMHLDLTGLPPTPEEVESFVEQHAQDPRAAVAQLADRLLESPRYGERWARHWLDVARYAESTGKTVNFYYPQAWRYRDYVIAAFNADKPYDQLIKEQLAGDLLPSDDPRVEAERTIATGFLAIGPKILNERSGLKFELDVVDEQIDVTTQAFLGITVACARCHDHKFDPIPQADYYALAGIFRSTETCYGTVTFINARRSSSLLTLPADADVATAGDKLTARGREALEGQIQSVRDSMRSMTDPLQQFFASGRLSLLQSRLDSYDDEGNPKLLAMGVRDKRAGREFGLGMRRPRMGGGGGYSYDASRTIGDSPLYLRGEHERPGETIPRGALQVIATSASLEMPATSSGRLELAEWIASRDNPLTARVLVNRVWLKLFGRGLVPTSDDFGMAGRAPTHPELLDRLAIQFMDEGWSVKRLIKELVTSRVYQLASTSAPLAMELDPDNTLYWHTAPRKLDAECLRDTLLAVSGQIETTPPAGSVVARAGEGPVARPFQPRDAVMASINDPRETHRSIYLPILRDNLPEALDLFDGADPSLITAERSQTTVASQGLFLLNNELVARAADAAAETLLKLERDSERIYEAFVQFYSRPPTPAELASAEKFLARYREQMVRDEVSDHQRDRELWSAFSQALFSGAEFQYRK